jgi:hypothetical protein
MSRFTPIFLCLLLLFGTVCPAFCVQQPDAHHCCHSKARGTLNNPCGQSALAQVPDRYTAPPQTALRPVETNRLVSFAYAPIASLAPAPSDPRPPTALHRILRI